MQKEAYYLGVPCVTLREETEWPETVEAGWNRLMGVNPGSIVKASCDFPVPTTRPPLYGDGNTSVRVCQVFE